MIIKTKTVWMSNKHNYTILAVDMNVKDAESELKRDCCFETEIEAKEDLYRHCSMLEGKVKRNIQALTRSLEKIKAAKSVLKPSVKDIVRRARYAKRI